MQNEVNVRLALRIMDYLSVDTDRAPSRTLGIVAKATADVLRWILEEENHFGAFLEGAEAIVDEIEAKLKETPSFVDLIEAKLKEMIEEDEKANAAS